MRDASRERRHACGPPVVDADRCKLGRLDQRMNRYFAPNAVAAGQVDRSLGTVPGILTYVAHHVATGWGWMVLALLAAVHVAGERSARTIDQSVLRAGRPTFLAAKVMSLFLAGMAGLVAATVVLCALRSTFVQFVGIPPGDQGLDGIGHGMVPVPLDARWASWAHALGAVGRAAVVLLAMAILFGVVAPLFREPATAAVALGALVLGLFLLANWAPGASWAPLRAISAFLGFDGAPYGIRDARLWETSTRVPSIYGTAPHVPVSWHAAVWVVAYAAAVAGASRIFLRRRVL